jgi:N-acetylneuraminic acid mutarotase
MKNSKLWKWGLLFTLLLLSVDIMAQNGWTKLSAQTTRSRVGSGACAIGDSIIYVIGGYGYENEGIVETFNPKTNEWVLKDSMITPRGFIACEEVDGKIYVMGGGYPDSTDKNEAFEIGFNQWSNKNNIPCKKHSMSTAFANGNIYVIAGSNSRDCWAYSPVLDKFFTRQSMPQGSGGLICAASYKGFIYTFGGSTYSPMTPLNDVYFYNPGADQWIKKNNLPTPRFGARAFLLNNKIYVIGGSQANNTALKTVEVYDPSTNTWKKLPDMPQAMVFFSGAVLNNKIYLFGGTEDWHWNVWDVWQFDPGSVTGIEQDLTTPKEFMLYQNYPNPFNPTTNFEFRISNFEFVSLRVIDLLGREVATLVSEEKPAGTYKLTWNAAKLPSGVYFYQLKAGSYTATKKLLLLK